MPNVAKSVFDTFSLIIFAFTRIVEGLNFSRNDSLSDKRLAFTLAEVLITLGIIGVVAALTIPTLINNIQDKAYITAWKKEYSTLNQAFALVLQDYGGTVKGYPSNNGSFSRDAFAKYLAVSKSCDTVGSIVGECWFDTYSNPTLKLLGGGVVLNWGPAGDFGLTLSDGAFIRFRDDRIDCDLGAGGWGNGSHNVCSEIWVDTNGQKQPNTVGKDVFLIYMAENKLIPAGAMGTVADPSLTCTTAKNPSDSTARPDNTTLNTGYGCAAAYLGQ